MLKRLVAQIHSAWPFLESQIIQYPTVIVAGAAPRCKHPYQCKVGGVYGFSRTMSKKETQKKLM